MSNEEGQHIDQIKREAALRDQVRTAINNPMLSLEYLGSFWQGKHEPSANRVLLTDLTLQGVSRFYEIVREELAEVKARGDTQISHWLDESLTAEPQKQTTFDHEISHVRRADELGVDLSKSQLELFFLTDGFGLQLSHQFIPPDDIDAQVKLQIALAPEEPSGPDIQVVKQVVKENPELLEEAINMYAERTGKSLTSLLSEGSE